MRGKCCDAGRVNTKKNDYISQNVAPTCTLSPDTFKVCIDEMILDVEAAKHVFTMGEGTVSGLTFADDIPRDKKTRPKDCKNKLKRR